MEFKDMQDGARYSFRDKFGSPRAGSYEQESGNFFCGHGETYLSHSNYYEMSACSKIKKLD